MHIPWGVKIINNDTKNYDYELIDKNKILSLLYVKKDFI